MKSDNELIKLESVTTGDAQHLVSQENLHWKYGTTNDRKVLE